MQPVNDIIESNGLQEGAGLYSVWMYTVSELVQKGRQSGLYSVRVCEIIRSDGLQE